MWRISKSQLIGSAVLLAVTMVLALRASAAEERRSRVASAPAELGQIDWLRDFEQAKTQSKKRRKPILLLFQEVPGCDTCVTYGHRVLSHPLVVEAAETLFIPMVVYNNAPGEDEKIRQLFDEPASNNPVVRIVAASGKSLTSRLAGDYSVGGIVDQMIAALDSTHREIPKYLDMLREEESARVRGVEHATLAMHCFWEGEVALGAVPGVIETQPGFIGKTEVVDVEYDPRTIDYKSLLRQAIKHDSASQVFARTAKQETIARALLADKVVRSDTILTRDKQPKYHLFNTPFRYVPMTQLQAIRINEAISQRQDRDAKSYLSPRQYELLLTIQQHPDAGWPSAVDTDDLARAWQAAMAIADQFSQQ